MPVSFFKLNAKANTKCESIKNYRKSCVAEYCNSIRIIESNLAPWKLVRRYVHGGYTIRGQKEKEEEKEKEKEKQKQQQEVL